MGEEELGQEELLWDDQPWSFQNLQGEKEEEAPSPAAKRKKRGASEGGGGGESDDHELHIWTERERRKKMRNMFANLHALLPHIPPKADKSTIVDEAVKHIKKLEQTVEELKKRKLERLRGIITHHNPTARDSPFITPRKLAIQSREAYLAEQGSTSNIESPKPAELSGPTVFKTWTSPNVVLNVCGKEAHISICTTKKPGLLTSICFVMEKHSLEVVSAQICTDSSRCMYMIHTRANAGLDQFQQAFPVEEVYKQAAAEMLLWVNS